MATPTWVDSTEGSVTTSASWRTPGSLPTHQADDIIVVLGQVSGARTFTGPGGIWNELQRTRSMVLATVTEEDAPVAVDRRKRRSLPSIVDTQTPVAVDRRKRRSLPSIVDTQTPVALTRKKMASVGSATETDTAPAIYVASRIITAAFDHPTPDLEVV